MNILIVTQHYFPDRFRINEIAVALAQNGHNITVVTGLPDYATGNVPDEYRHSRKRREMLDDVSIVRVPTISRKTGILRRALNYASFLISSTFYVTFCHKTDYDVIFSYQTSPVSMAHAAVLMKKRSGKELFLYCLDLWPESLKAWGIGEDSLLFRLAHKYSRHIYAQCEQIGVSSLPFIDYLNRVNGVPVDAMTYLPQHAEDLALPSRTPEPDRTEFRFAFGGNIGSVQDVACIIRAAQRLVDLPQVRFDIYGDGSELANCKALAQELNVIDTVRFHGRVTPAVLKEEYAHVDAFLLTLKSEGAIGLTIPAKLQEYLSGGKPVFAAIGGAAADILREANCGLVAAPSDAEMLAANIRTYVSAPDNYRDWGTNARAYYEANFTKEIFMARLSEILTELAQK